jgi:MFS family permease
MASALTTDDAADPVRLGVAPAVQRRTLRVLVLAQVLSGAGLAAGITVGALLAQDMLGSTSLAGLPAALFTIGSAGAALLVGRLSQRGRRPGLAAGYLAGALGALGVVIAAVRDDVVLLFAALLVYGAGSATSLQARYAGADLAAPDHRGRAVSTVLVATTLGAVAGPNLTGVTGDVVAPWGIPPLAGPFLLAGIAYVAAGVVLGALLRPDPLLLARQLDGEAREHAARERAAGNETSRDDAPAPPSSVRRTILVAGTVMVLTQAVMVAVMTMTPIHMQAHHHTIAATGMVIAVHVGMMFLPSPLSGWLVDRFGPGRVAGGAALTLMLTGVVAAVAPPSSVAWLAVALGLLGLGWSLGLVSGTAMLTGSLPVATRAKTQGSVDLAVAVAGAAGGMGSGFVVASTSYATLAVGGGLVALAVLPLIALGSRPRIPAAR